MTNLTQKIIHIDLDAFFASVEQFYNPEYINKPVIVGGDINSRGVVATCSYEARKYGIKSAMSCIKAYKLCPKAIFLRPNINLYKKISLKIMNLFYEVTNKVEPISLDEAYLDVTKNKTDFLYAKDIAIYLQKKIKKEIGITASAGISSLKFVAKLASTYRKPSGLTIVPPDKIKDFISPMQISKLWSVGPVTQKKLENIKIKTIKDLQNMSLYSLTQYLGKQGYILYQFANLKDTREINPHKKAKSKCAEITLKKDTINLKILKSYLKKFSIKISEYLNRNKKNCKTITLKIKFSNFSIFTRSKTLTIPIYSYEDILKVSLDLLKTIGTQIRPIRLLGISVKIPNIKNKQLNLFKIS